MVQINNNNQRHAEKFENKYTGSKNLLSHQRLPKSVELAAPIQGLDSRMRLASRGAGSRGTAGPSPLKLVFVCACHSQTAAAAFQKAPLAAKAALNAAAVEEEAPEAEELSRSAAFDRVPSTSTTSSATSSASAVRRSVAGPLLLGIQLHLVRTELLAELRDLRRPLLREELRRAHGAAPTPVSTGLQQCVQDCLVSKPIINTIARHRCKLSHPR